MDKQGGNRETAGAFGMAHKAKLRCGEGKGHLLNTYCVLGHSCALFLMNPSPIALVAEYFHCTKENTKAGIGPDMLNTKVWGLYRAPG